MNNQQYYHILTIGVPHIVAFLTIGLLVSGFLQPSFEGADGERAKILDDNFCRVGAFITDEKATAEERSDWCNQTHEWKDEMVISAFFISLLTAFLIIRSMVKPVSEWGEDTKNRSALN